MSEPRNFWRSQLVWMMVVAFALRIAGILFFETYHVSASDADFHFGYEMGIVAKNICLGKGFSSAFGGDTGPTAIMAPLYPYVMAAVMKVFGLFTPASAFVILAINSILSAITCWPIVRIGERIMSPAVAKWSGWLWAALPFFMRWPASWMWDMSFSAFFLTIAVWQSLQLCEADGVRAWTFFGLNWGLAGLVNPALLGGLPVAGLIPAWREFRKGKKWLRGFLVSSLAFFVLVGPWLVRNRLVFGEWVFIRDNFPLEFRMGNWYGSNWMGWRGYHPLANPQQMERFRRLGELGYMKAMSAEVKGFIANNQRHFAEETAKRFWYFWNGEILTLVNDPFKQWMFWPFSLTGWLGCLLLFDREDKAPGLLFAGIMLLYPMPYYLTFMGQRYRHAIEPMLLLCTVFVIANFSERLKVRNTVKT
jgi:hypothetical protein